MGRRSYGFVHTSAMILQAFRTRRLSRVQPFSDYSKIEAANSFSVVDPLCSGALWYSVDKRSEGESSREEVDGPLSRQRSGLACWTWRHVQSGGPLECL
jgi:hypothetical protein